VSIVNWHRTIVQDNHHDGESGASDLALARIETITSGRGERTRAEQCYQQSGAGVVSTVRSPSHSGVPLARCWTAGKARLERNEELATIAGTDGLRLNLLRAEWALLGPGPV